MKTLFLIFLFLSMQGIAQTSPDSLLNILVQKEQQLVDGIATGDKLLWKSSLHDSCIIAVEDGSFITKEKFIEDLSPLPSAYRGMIKITEPKLKVYDNTSVLTFIDDEYLELYGQKIHTQYRQTDTWIKINGEWKIIALQLFEIPKNPFPINVSQKVLYQYIGVYELSADRKCVVAVEKGKLYAQKNNKEPTELLPETENVFFRKEDGRSRIIFLKDTADGKFKMIERRAGQDVVWKQVK